MKDEKWAIEGVNYWDNTNCPRDYLLNAMIDLLEFIEGREAKLTEVNQMSDEELRNKVGFYEYLAEK